MACFASQDTASVFVAHACGWYAPEAFLIWLATTVVVIDSCDSITHEDRLEVIKNSCHLLEF